MATNSTSANVLSEEGFQQVNGLLETVELAGQNLENPQRAHSQIPTGMFFFKMSYNIQFYFKKKQMIDHYFSFRQTNASAATSSTSSGIKRKAVDISNFIIKKSKMHAALSAKCREPRVQPTEEEANDPIEINDENDEEETIGEPIPGQIGNRPGAPDAQFKRQLAIVESDAKDHDGEYFA